MIINKEKGVEWTFRVSLTLSKKLSKKYLSLYEILVQPSIYSFTFYLLEFSSSSLLYFYAQNHYFQQLF